MEYILAGLVLILIALAESFRRERNALKKAVDVIAFDLAIYGTAVLRREEGGRVVRVHPTTVRFAVTEEEAD